MQSDCEGGRGGGGEYSILTRQALFLKVECACVVVSQEPIIASCVSTLHFLGKANCPGLYWDANIYIFMTSMKLGKLCFLKNC